MSRKGIKCPEGKDYKIFESIRDKLGGGSLIGIHNSLNPKLISEYNEEFELLVVETAIENKDISHKVRDVIQLLNN